MIRQMLMQKGIFFSDEEFKEALQAATADIKANNIEFNKRTSLSEMVEVTVRSIHMFQRCT